MKRVTLRTLSVPDAKRPSAARLTRIDGQQSSYLPGLEPGSDSPFQPRRFRPITQRDIDHIPQLQTLPADHRFDMKVVSNILPFRVNEYVLGSLIDWDRTPDDPVFQLTFPQRGMLDPAHFDRMATLVRQDASREEVAALATAIRAELNPHPAGQQALNVPRLDGVPVPGVQHKYAETVLFFPGQGQSCHAYCTFCFRWAQFVGDKALKFASSEAGLLSRYLAANRNVTDLLMTGGDPMVMKTRLLAQYLEPLLEIDHVQSIRLGSKSLTFWPHRFVTDPDADDLLRLIERLADGGKHVAFMAHVNHWRELETVVCREAIRRLRDAGAIIRAQAPVLKHINDDADTWATTWKKQVKLGIVPYYMFVERDTGARRYFEIPIARAYEIYRDAMRQVSGLARTARGPSMSAAPGKVEIQGVTEVAGEKVFVLRFIQGRRADWVQQPFFAKFDSEATWLNKLTPAFGEDRFFYEDEFDALQNARTNQD